MNTVPAQKLLAKETRVHYSFYLRGKTCRGHGFGLSRSGYDAGIRGIFRVQNLSEAWACVMKDEEMRPGTQPLISDWSLSAGWRALKYNKETRVPVEAPY